MVYTPKFSFATGEVSPAMYGRVDVSMYDGALKRARNTFVRPHGGISNRAGTAFIREVKDSTKYTRAIKFSFNDTDTYSLEFGDQYMRVTRNGGTVTEAAKTVTGATQADPVVVTTSGAHGYTNGDEVFITGVVGMTELNNRLFVVANVTATTFELTDKAGADIDGTGFTAYASGGEAAKVYEIATPYLEADLRQIRYVQSADTMYLVHPSYAPRKLTRTDHNAWTLTTITFAPAIAAPTGQSASASGLNAWVTATAVTAGDLRTNAGKLYLAASSGTTGGTAPTHTSGTVSDGAVNWTYQNDLITYNYKVTAIDDDTGEESLPSSAASVTTDITVSGVTVTVTWSAVTGAGRYVVYRDDNGVYGRIGGTEGTSFDDSNITPDLADTPPKSVNPFSGSGNYPSCVFQFEQRLGFAATNNRPRTVFMSTTANFENFSTRSPAQDDDAVTFSYNSEEVNKVKAMVSITDLVGLTSDTEWKTKGGGDVDFITPTSVLNRPQSYHGSADVHPLVIGSDIAFVEGASASIRTLSYEFARDRYGGNDIAILSEHLIDGKQIVEWSYAKAPHKVVWLVTDDGDWLSLTLQQEHDVIGWCKQEIASTAAGACTVESVSCVREGNEDITYLMVKRTINGRTVRYLERLHERRFATIDDAYFVDCGLTYDGAATTTITNLHHLEGETVIALADGNVIDGLVVSNGSVTLPHSAEKVHIGLSYVALIETLPPNYADQRGSPQGRLQRVKQMIMRVRDTRGIFFGPTEDKLIEWKQRTSSDIDDAIPAFTGDITQSMKSDWNRDGSIVIQQPYPLPMTILAIFPEYETGG